MYNSKLKVYQNGTVQFTFYSEGIRTKEDRWKKVKFTELNDNITVFDSIKTGEFLENPYEDYKYSFVKHPKERATELIEKNDAQKEIELQKKKDANLRTSRNRSLKKIYDYGRSNVWEWFFTFTFSPVDGFDKDNYTECQKKVSEWFKNVRKRYSKDIKYLVVPEQHKSGAWHFHALVANCEELTFDKAINNQELYVNKKGNLVPNKYFGQYLRTKYPSGNFIYNIRQFNSGFTTATRILDTRKAVSYIVKYITKDLSNITFGKRRYLPSNNLDVPEVYCSIVHHNEINDVLCDIEYSFGVKLSIDCVKTYVVNVEGYYNAITVFEFNPLDFPVKGGGEDS